MASTGPTAGEQHAKANMPGIPCIAKEDMFIAHGVRRGKGRFEDTVNAPIPFQRTVRRSDAGPGEKFPAENTVFSLPAGASYDVVGEHLNLKRLL
jgi:hypothetical protein